MALILGIDPGSRKTGYGIINAVGASRIYVASGVAMVAAVNHGLPVSEYSARQVKQAVVGNGAAAKHQVQEMVARLLKLPGLPQEDAADALAIAICHANTHASLVRLATSRSPASARTQVLLNELKGSRRGRVR